MREDRLKLRTLKDYSSISQMAARQWVVLRQASPLTLANAAGIFYEYSTRKTILRHKPIILKIEPASYCNLRCPACHPDGNTFGGVMSDDVFRVFLDKAPLRQAMKGTVYMFGEPLYNRNIYSMIREISDRGVPTSISTNFHIFSEKDADALIDSGLSWILVCIDGATQETYEKYRIGGNLQRVLDNLEILVRRRAERGAKNPVIEVQSIKFDHNKHEIAKIREMCLSMGVDRFTTKDDVLPQVRGQVERSARNPKRTCFYLYGSLMVDYDGIVIPCCLGRYEFGNLMESSFEEIWNNRKFVAARTWFASGQTEKDDSLDLPCYSCPLFT